MIYIGIKDFQSNIYLYLKSLPVVLTKHDVPFAKISKYDEVDEEIELERLKKEDKDLNEILKDL